MDSIIEFLHVKRKSLETPTLTADKDGPILHIGEHYRQFKDSPLARWLLKAHFPSMHCTPAGRAWWTSQPNPTILDPDVLHLLTYELKPYQKMACARMLIENSAQWLDMGLGKTLVSIAYLLMLFKKTGLNNFLVVCPTTVFVSWTQEIARQLDGKVPYRIILAHGYGKAKEIQKLRTQASSALTIILTSYETLVTLRDHLKHINLGAILLDEVSKVKNYNAKRTQATREVIHTHPAAAVHLLSGTPSTKSPEGFYSLYELLGKGRSGCRDLVTFKATYIQHITLARCQTSDGQIVFIRADDGNAFEKWMANNSPLGQTQTYKQLGYILTGHSPMRHMKNYILIKNTFQKPVGVKNIENLQKYTLRNAYSLKKENVAKELPEKTFTVRHVEMSKEIAEAYEAFVENNHVELGAQKFTFRATGPHIKLHQIANGFFYDAAGVPHWFDSQPKIDELLQILDEAGEQKVVIWSPFRPQIKRVSEALTEAGLTHEVIHGDVAVADRPALVARFREDPAIKYLIANPDVAGMGLTLTEAHLAIVLTNWFKPDVRNQLVDRLHRIGQVNPVTVVDLVTPNTLETRILNSLKNNINIEGSILTGADLKGDAHDDDGAGQEPGDPEADQELPRGNSQEHRQPGEPVEQRTV